MHVDEMSARAVLSTSAGASEANITITGEGFTLMGEEMPRLTCLYGYEGGLVAPSSWPSTSIGSVTASATAMGNSSALSNGTASATIPHEFLIPVGTIGSAPVAWANDTLLTCVTPTSLQVGGNDGRHGLYIGVGSTVFPVIPGIHPLPLPPFLPSL